jgi:hypothetical protein
MSMLSTTVSQSGITSVAAIWDWLVSKLMLFSGLLHVLGRLLSRLRKVS